MLHRGNGGSAILGPSTAKTATDNSVLRETLPLNCLPQRDKENSGSDMAS